FHHSSENEDLETGKCSGYSKWAFEFTSCDIKKYPPPWWCPPGDNSEGDSTRNDDSIQHDDELELGNVSKRRRVDVGINPESCNDVPILDPVEQQEESSAFDAKAIPNRPRVNSLLIDPILRDNAIALGGLYANQEIRQAVPADGDTRYPSGLSHMNAPPICLPNIGNLPAPVTTDKMEVDCSVEPPEIHPEQLGLSLEPIVGTDGCLSRAPKLRASLLLGWHCLTCGRLNPRREWSKHQSCPLCKATSTLILPEWHRRAHTEAAGPIGTLFRLDDGGHQPKTGLHQMAARDEETGLTFVEYWLAEAPMPIIAELNRDASVDRR
ncbi:unnamed protein product, partial [Rhizoctonia solani]